MNLTKLFWDYSFLLTQMKKIYVRITFLRVFTLSVTGRLSARRSFLTRIWMRGRFGRTVTGLHDARAVMLKRGVMWWWGWLSGWWRGRSWWGVGGRRGGEVVREEKRESSGAHHHDGGADLEHLRVGRMENRQQWEALRRRAHFGFPPPAVTVSPCRLLVPRACERNPTQS